VFQVAVTEVEERTNVRFADEMRDSDTFAVPEAIEDRQPLGDPADIQW
jgi:endonuclease G